MFLNQIQNKSIIPYITLIITCFFLAYLVTLTSNQGTFCIDILFCIISLATSLFLIYKSFQSFKIITIPFIFFVFSFIFIYLGSITYYFGWVEIIGFNSYYYTDTNNKLILIINNLGMIVFSLSLHMTNYFMKFNPKKEPLKYINKKLIDNIKLNPVMLSVIVVTLLSSLLYLSTAEIPLFYLLKNIGNTSGILESRSNFTLQRSNILQMYMFYGIALPITSFICLIKYLHSKAKLWKYLSIFIIMTTVLTFIASTQRWPILYYIIFLLVLLFNYNSDPKKQKKDVIKTRLIYLGSLGFLFFITFIFTSLKWGLSVQVTLIALCYRLLVVQAAMNIFVIKYFPIKASFLYGAGYLQDLSTILPGPQEGTATTLYHLILGDNAFLELGSAPIGILADAYMNFGLVGSLIIIMLFGAFLQLLQIFFVRTEKNISNMVIYSYLIIILALCSEITAVSIFLLYCPIIVLFYFLFSYKLKIKF